MAAKAQPPKRPKVRSPASHEEWLNLMHQTIDRANKLGDRRLSGLRQALVSGKIEEYLRKLGIISLQDILREFPEKE